MSTSVDLKSSFDSFIDSEITSGNLNVIHFGLSGTGWDDTSYDTENPIVQTGSSWAQKAIILPVGNKGEDKRYLEQGQINLQDKKVFTKTDTFISGNDLLLFSAGSYSVVQTDIYMPDGATGVYRRTYCRYKTWSP